MNATLPPDVQQFVSEQVAAGRYPSEADLVIDAVRKLREDELNFQRFKAQLEVRVERLARGEGTVVQRDELRSFLDRIVAKVNRELEAQRAHSA